MSGFPIAHIVKGWFHFTRGFSIAHILRGASVPLPRTGNASWQAANRVPSRQDNFFWNLPTLFFLIGHGQSLCGET